MDHRIYTSQPCVFQRYRRACDTGWKTSWSLKNWDFICSGPDQAIARFSSNTWAVSKAGKFEFMGTPSKALKEEILVIGFTLFYCMLYRANSLPAFPGAFFASTGPVKEGEDLSRSNSRRRSCKQSLVSFLMALYCTPHGWVIHLYSGSAAIATPVTGKPTDI
ncbi:hypothetical protein AC579_5804 [Pseudocercospora musae]|uniref:Uncharacterized protein n=1 Tax=Pseudocercospora musae TaxID=113226 RepID=A0A139IR34_9PEZI|nr:hypothetical protein AC579_5804 [Pseudocercospora musae]